MAGNENAQTQVARGNQGALRARLEAVLLAVLHDDEVRANLRDEAKLWGPRSGEPQEADLLVLVGETRSALRGTAYARVAAQTGSSRGGDAGVVSSVVREGVSRGLMHGVRDCRAGGLAAAIAGVCVESRLGVYSLMDPVSDPDFELFAETPGRAVVFVRPTDADAVGELLDDIDVPYVALGQVGGDTLTLETQPDHEVLVDLSLSCVAEALGA